MPESLADIAKRIEAKAWNRSGTDKTWVLNAMSAHLQFRKEVRFEAGGEPFVDLDDALVLRRIVENGASRSAIHTESSEMDLCQPPCRVQPTLVTSTLLRLGGRGAERRLRR